MTWRAFLRRLICDHCFVFDERIPAARGATVLKMICAFCAKPKRVGFLRD